MSTDYALSTSSVPQGRVVRFVGSHMSPSGIAVPETDAAAAIVVISMKKLDRILDIDVQAKRVIIEPGKNNLFLCVYYIL